MNASSRRIYLYWVLLLLPTLGVGLGAIYLLNREEGRLLARAGQLEEARRTALRARAQLAAENAELIVSDLQTALLDTLALAPAGDADAFLLSLERVNPLVHSSFRCDASGKLLRPLFNDEDEKARGFHRRFSAALRAAPFVPGARREEADRPLASFDALPEKAKDAKNVVEPALQDSVSNYAQNVQNARRDVQSLAKLSREQLAPAKGGSSPSSAKKTSHKTLSAASQAAAPQPAAFAETSASTVGSMQSFDAPKLEAVKEAAREASAPLERRGWFPVALDNRLFLLGYVQAAPTAEVRGVEVDMTALVSRLGAALPPDLGAGEGLCLKNEHGRIFHQAGLLAVGSTLVTRVPLNRDLLPGWWIEAYLAPSGDSGIGSGPGFLLTGTLLAAILVIALLSGGFLLLQHARDSAREALLKTSFVANVSHELKTPLTTIRLYADLLEQGRVPSEERRAEYLRTIGRESERLSRLVNNVLDFSRLERGLRAFTLVPVDPAAELRRICDVNTPRLTEAGLRLSLVLPDETLRVAVDRDALGQILLNLMDNAVKYAAAGGELRISLSSGPGGRVLLRVADRGPGVPDQERERIFLKFHRVDQSLTAEKGGAGLGLSIARQLARAMHGELSCLPGEGGGALFELSLPPLPREDLV